MEYFGGVEGGSTESNFVILNKDGQCVSSISGNSTNPLLIGEVECFSRLADLARKAKLAANIPQETPLETIGLCLSGCISKEEGARFSSAFLEYDPSIAKSCSTTNDLVGPVYTSNLKAGIVIISGTGSNSLLFSNGNLIKTCGGWGHLFGDEGSAYWIASRAYKTLLDDNDGYEICEHETKRLRQVICDHFKLADEKLIGCFYQHDHKRKFASLSKALYESNKTSRDPAIEDIFRQAGHKLAMKVIALLRHTDESLTEAGLNIICVGSVFKSWDLLESGFVETLGRRVKNFRLLGLKISSAYGAARLGAQCVGIDLQLGHSTDLLYAYSATAKGYQANGRHVLMLANQNGFKQPKDHSEDTQSPMKGRTKCSMM